METKTAKSGQNDKKLIILGFISIGILFLIYVRFEYQEITPDAVQSIERLGVAFYVLFSISIGMIGIGLRKFQKRVASTGNTTALSMICSNTLGSKAKKTFIVTFIIYGVFFSMTSGILVYQPEVVFSYHYGADVPSAHVTPCCGPPGYMPKFVAYFTEHVGINIVPINLLLQITVSYLVATNTALAVNAIMITKKSGGLRRYWCNHRIIHCMSYMCRIIFIIIYWSNKCSCIYNCSNRTTNNIHSNYNTNIDFNTIYNFKKNTKISK